MANTLKERHKKKKWLALLALFFGRAKVLAPILVTIFLFSVPFILPAQIALRLQNIPFVSGFLKFIGGPDYFERNAMLLAQRNGQGAGPAVSDALKRLWGLTGGADAERSRWQDFWGKTTARGDDDFLKSVVGGKDLQNADEPIVEGEGLNPRSVDGVINPDLREQGAEGGGVGVPAELLAGAGAGGKNALQQRFGEMRNLGSVGNVSAGDMFRARWGKPAENGKGAIVEHALSQLNVKQPDGKYARERLSGRARAMRGGGARSLMGGSAMALGQLQNSNNAEMQRLGEAWATTGVANECPTCSDESQNTLVGSTYDGLDVGGEGLDLGGGGTPNVDGVANDISGVLDEYGDVDACAAAMDAPCPGDPNGPPCAQAKQEEMLSTMELWKEKSDAMKKDRCMKGKSRCRPFNTAIRQFRDQCGEYNDEMQSLNGVCDSVNNDPKLAAQGGCQGESVRDEGVWNVNERRFSKTGLEYKTYDCQADDHSGPGDTGRMNCNEITEMSCCRGGIRGWPCEIASFFACVF